MSQKDFEKLLRKIKKKGDDKTKLNSNLPTIFQKKIILAEIPSYFTTVTYGYTHSYKVIDSKYSVW